jgi:3-phenylpropionate/trans-cinnamate dioxygenase ferredoxin subunit
MRTKICRRDDLRHGEVRRFDVAKHRIAVVRIEDTFYAVGDRCSHAEASLAEGEVFCDLRELECPQHGSAFSLTTGEALTLPATQPVPVYTVTVVEDDVFLEIGP